MENIITLDEVDKLKLENFQLRFAILKQSYSELKLKEFELQHKQNEFAVELEKKYNISLQDYNIDLMNGICSLK